jgi:hypothetical protein
LEISLSEVYWVEKELAISLIKNILTVYPKAYGVVSDDSGIFVTTN